MKSWPLINEQLLALIGFDFVAVEDVAVDLEDAPSHVTCNDRYVVSVSINQDFNIGLKVTKTLILTFYKTFFCTKLERYCRYPV